MAAREVKARHLIVRTLRGRSGYRAHRLFRDPATQHDLAVHGYHVTSTEIDPAAVVALRAACLAWVADAPAAPPGRFHSSYELQPSAAGAAARAEVIDVLLPQLAPMLTDEAHLRPSVFQYKPPGPASGLRAHQDPRLLDEATSCGQFAWVALTDVTFADGPLVVLPGSHRFGPWSRASAEVDPYEAHQQTIERHARFLEVRAGQVVWFDNALIHGSLPNSGDAPRLAVSAVVSPKSTEMLFPLRVAGVGDVADVYRIDPAASTHREATPVGALECLGRVDLDRIAFGPGALGAAARMHRTLHRAPSGANLPAGASCIPN